MSLMLMTGLALAGTVAAKSMVATTHRMPTTQEQVLVMRRAQQRQLVPKANTPKSTTSSGMQIREIEDENPARPVQYALVCDRNFGGHFDMYGNYTCN